MKAVIGMQIVFLYITKKAVQAIREQSKIKKNKNS